MQRMFGSISSASSTDSLTSSSDSSTTSSALTDFLLRQKASSAYQSIDNLIAGLFGDGGVSQSVSLSA